MHAFLPCFLPFLFTLPFPFSLLFLFSILIIFQHRLLSPLYVTITISIYTRLSLWDFSLLPLWLTNHFRLVTQPPPTMGMLSTFSPFHYPFHDKFQFVWFYREPFPLLWIGKAIGLTPYLPGMHQVVPATYYLFWAMMSSQQCISQKRSQLET